MNVEHYTPVHFSKKAFQTSHFFSTHFEPLILSMLVLTGIIGSIILFGQEVITSNSVANAELNQLPTPPTIASLFAVNDEEYTTKNFDDYIKMQGSVKAGENFFFTFLADEAASRYVMEMGDGVRLIVTQKNLLYQYEKPGKYVIELKEIKDGLMNIVGTKKIKVKD
ncbi:MAG: hypothetical protein WAU01_17895 [Saprospiraceae bacterium]